MSETSIRRFSRPVRGDCESQVTPAQDVDNNDLADSVLKLMAEGRSPSWQPLEGSPRLARAHFEPSWLRQFSTISGFDVIGQQQDSGGHKPLALVYEEQQGGVAQRQVFSLFDPASDFLAMSRLHRWLNSQATATRPTVTMRPLVRNARIGRNTIPVLPTVFDPNDRLFADRLFQVARPFVRGKRNILVLGSGTGVDALWAAQQEPSAQITASDINPLAVLNTRLTMQMHGAGSRSQSVVSDGFNQITGRYDLILFNAPFPRDADDAEANELGYHDRGGQLLRRTLDGASDYLTEDGVMLWMSSVEFESFHTDNSRSRLVVRVERDFRDVFGGLYAIYSLRRR